MVRVPNGSLSRDLGNPKRLPLRTTVSELKRLLKKHGCSFHEGTRHTIVSFQGRSTTPPRHPSQEVGTGIVKSIFKKLGFKEQ